MVTVFLRGGLGNQMFQYALGLNLAKKNGAKLVLDTVFLSDRFPRRNFTYRNYALDVFTIEPAFTPLSRLASAASVPGVWLGLDLLGAAVRGRVGLQTPVYEKSDAFDPLILEARGNLLLFGRWENEKYFADMADEVRAAFRFRYPLEGDALALAKKIASCNSISVHVRRGDYIRLKNVEKMMGTTSPEYYLRAARCAAGRTHDPRFFVFSDDTGWCRANLKLPFPTTYVDDASQGPKASWHMALMSRCKHNIITNSTFSWWGAWLNVNPGKIVVAPVHWHADSGIAKDDIIPKSWIVL